jgi:proline dehydrogenase
VLRRGFLRLSDSRAARSVATHAPLIRPMSRRFVAGETLDEFLQIARSVREAGYLVTANYLGEAVRDPGHARAAAEGYLALLDRLPAEELEVNVSLKLTQLGFDLGERVFHENLDRVVEKASGTGAFLRFDMESGRYTARTLELAEQLWTGGNRRIGVVLQAYLRRTAGDLRRMIELGIPVRLCKGAYAEPPSRAFRDPEEVRSSFREGMRWLLTEGDRPAIATHDEGLIRDTLMHAKTIGADPRGFELQMLYGMRRDLQRELLEGGYRVRVYIPYGENWYPYLMRRLAERPENLVFMAGTLVRESPLGALLPGRRRVGAGER